MKRLVIAILIGLLMMSSCRTTSNSPQQIEDPKTVNERIEKEDNYVPWWLKSKQNKIIKAAKSRLFYFQN